MKRFIAVTEKQRQLIVDAFKITPRMVRLALSYDSDSNLARRIRKLALESGGVKMMTIEEIETIHDADGMMKQLLPNGAVIEIDKTTGNVEVYFKSLLRLQFDNIRVRELAALQAAAMALK